MKSVQFRELLESVARLSLMQRRLLEQALQEATSTDQALDVANDRAIRVHISPNGQSTNAWRWGLKRGVQRFRCKDCARTYNALTGIPLVRLKCRDAWPAYGEAMTEGLSIRNSAIFLESFKRSRHLPRPARKRGGGNASKRGVSTEQIPVLVVRDRHAKHFDQVLPAVDQATLGTILPQLLSDESILCLDGANVYKSVAKSFEIPHESLRYAKHGHVKDRIFTFKISTPTTVVSSFG